MQNYFYTSSIVNIQGDSISHKNVVKTTHPYLSTQLLQYIYTQTCTPFLFKCTLGTNRSLHDTTGQLQLSHENTYPPLKWFLSFVLLIAHNITHVTFG